ncbi:MAG: Thioredoxin-like protein [Collimonas fungivorans]|uniref:DsbA family protein n=1 Tax=Collimonas fungivorans TaxID=158899 RepID=UPI0026ECEBBC|nr:DsbA family protein [Collimonas fungivorans]MDB5766105.1 Thioredoxin-like protein [Collimonas fungivorans]
MVTGHDCDDSSCALPGAVESTTAAAPAAAQGTVLHYIYDPLCGWCYGAAPLLQAAREVAGLHIELHGGGMMTGSNRKQVSAQLRNYVMQHDQRIAAMTDQPFGDDYFNGLLLDTTAIFDSAPPTTAVLAADAIAGQGLAMLARIQAAHYVQGLRVADATVLHTLALQIGLDSVLFDSKFAELDGAATQAHIAGSRALLARVGGQGFPTFVLQRGAQIEVLDAGRFLGQVQAWKAALSA